LFTFGQSRVGYVGGYVQALKNNAAFSRIFEDSIPKNKNHGIILQEKLAKALKNGDQKQFSAVLKEAVACDKLVGIETKWLPRLYQ